MRNIQDSTPIYNFPEIYNQNNEELIEMIRNLENRITQIIAEKNEEISRLQVSFTQLKSEFEDMIDAKMTEFEGRFDGKMTDFEDRFNDKMDDFESKFQRKEN